MPPSAATATQRSPLPNPRTADDALAVTDGASTAGFLIERDGSFFAFDQDDTLLGECATRTQAACAIPRVRA
jgi:hypothetical protein